MPTYTVQAVTGSTPKEYNGKQMQEITFTLSDGAMSEACTWFTKAETPVPAVGSTIEGEIDRSNPQYPPKFKKAFSGGGFKPQGMSPEREKKIVRQHSQAQAIAFLAATQKDGFRLADVKTVTDWFDADVFGSEAVQPTLDSVLVGAGVSDDTPPF